MDSISDVTLFDKMVDIILGHHAPFYAVKNILVAFDQEGMNLDHIHESKYWKDPMVMAVMKELYELYPDCYEEN